MPARCTACSGPNGAGKSTLIKCVSGVVAPTEGEILVDGEPLPTGEPSESLARGVATIYQELDLVEDLTVAESVFLGHEPRRAGLLDRARMRREATELLTRLDHGDIPPDAHVRTLRPAAQQVVSIARALSHRVRLLIMDEPSAILDDQEIEVALRRRPAPGRRRGRRDLHLPPARRDQPDRRPRDGARRRQDRRDRPARRHAAGGAGPEDGRPAGRAAVPRPGRRRRGRRPRRPRASAGRPTCIRRASRSARARCSASAG